MPSLPDRLPLAITMGEPAGIGGEIVLAAWQALRGGRQAFMLLDDPARIAALAAKVGLAVPVATVATAAEACSAFASALPVLPIVLKKPVAPGRPDGAHASAVIESITKAVALARRGEVSAIVTNPIHKATLYEAGFPHPGHTEFLGELAGTGQGPAMMLATPGLRVVPVTVHVALSAALAMLRTDLIVEQALLVHRALVEDFGIPSPRLAIAGLNPHAGEAGTMGREEIDIIAPAVERLRRRGIDTAGPLSPDTMFGARTRQGYDVAICMYHDQALIPLKTIDMESGVNVTLGLSIVRTSPDHGTALDLAGTGRASPASLIAAIRMAADIAGNRSRRTACAA